MVGRELGLSQEPSLYAEGFRVTVPPIPASCAGNAAAFGSFFLELLHCCLSLVKEVSSAL